MIDIYKYSSIKAEFLAKKTAIIIIHSSTGLIDKSEIGKAITKRNSCNHDDNSTINIDLISSCHMLHYDLDNIFEL